ncbi:hypothetical protein CBW24_16075 (plasmid) [Pacificitalea manganoxidans]|uniref:Acyl-CoA dehydrogenase n=1 Tax=Pacificitalea manganoxidans TaxID=1411902 RepID=A0A291M3W3_9RHOB|nr:acyl-CoA dehydrogenase family protein [Pacificitalea manganoxidans]ATI43673.1 hypothetical protein CBW24_16075 [Pacificitalea manganoxidans]MDR6310067.1 alkylation response protein AidB-like acyl-CoA dehydrogenase [Pacificitalea manganoxidans]
MLKQIVQVSDESEIFRDALEKAIENVSPLSRVQELDNSKTFDSGLHSVLSELQVLGVGVPEESGGAGGDAIDQVITLEVLGRKATSMAVYMVVHFMITRILLENGNAEQIETYLRPLVEGRIKASFCLTESGGGTDILSSMKTRATPDGDGWRLNGNKMWISGASTSDIYIVLARTAEHHTRGVTMFLVPANAKGVSAQELQTVAINGYDTNEIAFDDVAVGPDAVLGVVDDGFPQVIATLNGERMNAAAVAVGIGRGAIEVTRDYALERTAFDRPVGQFQAVQHQLAVAGTAVEAAWLLTLEAARNDAAGRATDVVSSMAKYASARAAVQATDTGMDIFAGAGFDTSLPIQRYLRDARLYSFAPLNNNTTLNMIAERWLELPRAK